VQTLGLHLLRVTQTMTDRAIAGQLRALAEDYQRRAEKASSAERKWST
jgi:hypothetical protein